MIESLIFAVVGLNVRYFLDLSSLLGVEGGVRPLPFRAAFFLGMIGYRLHRFASCRANDGAACHAKYSGAPTPGAGWESDSVCHQKYRETPGGLRERIRGNTAQVQGLRSCCVPIVIYSRMNGVGLDGGDGCKMQ